MPRKALSFFLFFFCLFVFFSFFKGIKGGEQNPVKVASDHSHLLGSGENSGPAPVLDAHDSDDEMTTSRPPSYRPIDGNGHDQYGYDGHQPLLKEEQRGRSSNASYGPGDVEGRPMLHHAHVRSQSPGKDAEKATRRKYMIAAVFLLLSLVSFVAQTESAVYIQHELHWNKPYFML